MTTDAQIEANRENAQHSAGPKTLRGKLRSARNALRHGFRAKIILDCRPRAGTAARFSPVANEPNFRSPSWGGSPRRRTW